MKLDDADALAELIDRIRLAREYGLLDAGWTPPRSSRPVLDVIVPSGVL